MDKFNDLNEYKEFEKKLIHSAIDAIGRCVEHHDMETVLVLCELCKCLAGDTFEVTIELERK